MKQLKQVRSWQYVKYRGAQSQRLRKFTQRAKLIAEVYSKKTHKRLGVLNYVKDGLPQGRYYTKKQKHIYHEGRRFRLRRQKEIIHDNSFRINCNRMGKWISDQIPDWLPKKLNDVISDKGYVQFGFGFAGKDSSGLDLSYLKTRIQGSPNIKSKKEWVDIIANLIVETFRDNRLRTSPKLASKQAGTREYWHFTAKIRGKTKNVAEYRYLRLVTVFLRLIG